MREDRLAATLMQLLYDRQTAYQTWRRCADGKSLNILALNWRCLRNPDAGGAEVNIFRQRAIGSSRGTRLHFSALIRPPVAPQRNEVVDGICGAADGNRFTVYLLALLYYWRRVGVFDCIVDVSNGIPFFSPLTGPYTPHPGRASCAMGGSGSSSSHAR